MLRNAFCSFRDKFYPGCRAAVVVRMNATKVRTPSCYSRSMFVFLIPLYRAAYWRHLQLCSRNGDFCKTWEGAEDCCVQERERSHDRVLSLRVTMHSHQRHFSVLIRLAGPKAGTKRFLVPALTLTPLLLLRVYHILCFMQWRASYSTEPLLEDVKTENDLDTGKKLQRYESKQ